MLQMEDKQVELSEEIGLEVQKLTLPSICIHGILDAWNCTDERRIRVDVLAKL